MRITLIVAVARNGVIGREGDIPWRLRDDQRFFQQQTLGHSLLMGRATYDSIGRPLPKRTTYVLTRNPDFAAEGVTRASSLDEAIALAEARGESELFVAGGEAVYREAMPRADRLLVTRVDAAPEGDVRFPDFDESRFERTAAEPHAADDRNDHAFTIETWQRR